MAQRSTHNPVLRREAEERLRRLLAENDLPMPDEVLHRPAEVVFLYDVQKLAFVFEIDEAPG